MDSEANQKLKDWDKYPHKQLTSDDITRNSMSWYYRDDLPSTISNGCFIYNLDDTENSGTHWTTVCLRKPIIFYFDPFGTNLSGYPPEDLREWGVKHGFTRIYANEFDIQPIKSWLCGYYALYMAKKLNTLKTLTENSFDNLIKKEFDTSPTNHNVQKITEWAKGLGLL